MHKKYTYLMLASSFLVSTLVGCSNNIGQPKEADTFDVTFHHANDETKNVKVAVSKGETVYTALDGNLSSVEELCKSETLHFDNWFISKEAAASLNYGDNNQNLFKYDAAIESSLDLYPGFALDGFNEELNVFLEEYLGAYHKANTSRVPFLRTNKFHKDDNEENVFFFDNASSIKFEEYKKDLVELNGFKEIEENKFLDKLQAYTLKLEHLVAQSSIKVTIDFNDEVGKFPSKFFASNFPALDTSYYINDKNFTLSENIKEEDLSKKFITAAERSLLTGNELRKTIFYTPKKEDKSPLNSLGTWLQSSGVLQPISSNQDTFVDMFGNTLVSISQVNKVIANAYQDKGVKEGMIAINFQDLYTKENDVEGLKEYFKEITGGVFPEDLFFSIDGASAYGTLLGYTVSGNLPAVGQHVSGISKENFDAWLRKEKEAGMNVISSYSGQSYLSNFKGTSPNGEYVFQASFYDATKLTDITQNVVQVIYYRNQSVYEKLEKWFEVNNVGGGKITSLPELPATSITSGNLSVDSTTIYYGYYLNATGIDATKFAAYKKTLLDTNNWVDGTKEGDKYPTFVSKCSYYSLMLIHDAEKNTLVIQIIYNAIRETTSLEQALKFIAPRFGLDTFFIPGLQELYNQESTKPLIQVAQYYNKSEHRGHLVISLNSIEKVNQYLTTIETKLENDSKFTFVGENKNGIKFYQDNGNGHIIYLSNVSNENGETPTYELLICIYKDIK